MARSAGIPLVVDSTVATPYVCRPMEWGADIVVHSATKFLGGHGTSLGGVVIESGRFDWGNGNFPRMTEPVASYGDLSWWGNFGEFAFCTRLRAEQLRDVGPTLSPFNAFLLMQGVETLPQRMDAHLSNARVVADALCRNPAVSWVRWAGLARPSAPRTRCSSTCRSGPARCSRSVSSAGAPEGRRSSRRWRCAATSPTSAIRARWSSTLPAPLIGSSAMTALQAGGVPADLIRISVGIEDPDDIIWDIEQALSRRGQGGRMSRPGN